MRTKSDDSKNAAELDQLIPLITTGAHGDDEHFRAFQRAIQSGVDLPCDAFVIGEPVSVVAFDYDGNQRRGLVARCRREDGSEHVVGAAEVVLAPRTHGTHYLAAYRKWLGLDPPVVKRGNPVPVRDPWCCSISRRPTRHFSVRMEERIAAAKRGNRPRWWLRFRKVRSVKHFFRELCCMVP
ncbi:MAG: hypothetical protein HY735_06580 [Verrucomicrobia bacterium]|nr:hypothetical protein [Verrucomicrobiota bacterium]